MVDAELSPGHGSHPQAGHKQATNPHNTTRPLHATETVAPEPLSPK